MGEESGRRRIQDIPPDESRLADLVPLCGGLVPAVLFNVFEQLFQRAGQGVKEVSGTNRDWLDLLHMRPSWFSKAFSRIGISHIGHSTYVIARIQGREFWSPRFKRYLFYSFERADRGQRCTLRRNADAIERLHRKLNSIPNPPPVMENRGAKRAAREDAQAFIQKYFPD